MPNVLQLGAAWLGERMQALAGRMVTVRQGGVSTESITAWHELVGYDVVDQDGFSTSVESFDWRFVAADLPTGFVFRDGALIVEEIAGGLTNVFEVMPIGTKKCSEKADSSGVLLTVHSKQVS